ncbi:hypothetical protein SZ54_4379 [Rhizobium sp. UR51a]|nr:hypothetical protein SZ54_4379 [Rhizobium sp. UR51a]
MALLFSAEMDRVSAKRGMVACFGNGKSDHGPALQRTTKPF